MTKDETASLLIGAVLGDSDSTSMAWSRAIGTMSRRFEDLSRSVTSPLRLNVVFHVSGRILPNEFEGVRTGSFLKAKGLLNVQAAVPKASLPDAEAILLELLTAAVALAERFAQSRGIANDLRPLRDLVANADHAIG